MQKKVKVGVVGCGGICRATYMYNMVKRFNVIDVVGCYDLIESRMDYMVKKYGIRKYSSLEEICSDPEIQIIVNLTYPESHVLVSATAMMHGKHVYCEKMMAPTFEDATMLMKLMEENNVLFTTAPDTFLGAWEQSARFYLDAGVIGKPITIHAQVTSHYEPESPFFDEAPRFFFFPLHYGGGFPFDFGGYYLHQIINMLGSVKRVTGYGGNLNPHRSFINPHHPKYQEPFEVNTPTTLMAAMEFECGVLGTFHISSDSSSSQAFTVTGTKGTLNLWDPNSCGGKITLTRRGARPETKIVMPGQSPDSKMDGPAVYMDNEDGDAQVLQEITSSQSVELPLLHGFNDTSCRGVGLADMCYAILNGRRPRCHADIGYHAIEVIHGIQESCRTGKSYEMTSKCPRPAPLEDSALSATGQEATLDD